MRLTRQAAQEVPPPGALSLNLQVLQWLLDPAVELRQVDGAAHWHWRHVVAS